MVRNSCQVTTPVLRLLHTFKTFSIFPSMLSQSVYFIFYTENVCMSTYCLYSLLHWSHAYIFPSKASVSVNLASISVSRHGYWDDISLPLQWYLSGNSRDRSQKGSMVFDLLSQARHVTCKTIFHQLFTLKKNPLNLLKVYHNIALKKKKFPTNNWCNQKQDIVI